MNRTELKEAIRTIVSDDAAIVYLFTWAAEGRAAPSYISLVPQRDGRVRAMHGDNRDRVEPWLDAQGQPLVFADEAAACAWAWEMLRETHRPAPAGGEVRLRQDQPGSDGARAAYEALEHRAGDQTIPRKRPAKVHQSPIGWTATSDPAGTSVTLRDTVGQLRATWAVPARSAASNLQSVSLRRGEQHRIPLWSGSDPDGEAVVENGDPRPLRRRDHNGSIDLRGRRYELQHARRWRSTLLLDGRVVAVGRRGWFGRVFLERAAVADAVDELALALFWFAVSPGRPGLIWMTFDTVSV